MKKKILHKNKINKQFKNKINCKIKKMLKISNNKSINNNK